MISFRRVKKIFGFGKEPVPEQKEVVPKEPVQEEIVEEKQEQDTATELRKAMEAAEEECRFHLNAQMRAKYAEYLENYEIKDNYILYEAFAGRGMTCSPYAIFKYLMTQADFQKYVHVWVIEDFEDNQKQIARYEAYDNVRFVQYQSEEYREALATAKYLVNNVSFPGYFTKREGQVYVNTWHGIPLKTLGFDIPTGNTSAGNSAKNILAADYIVSPNDFMTEIYEKAYKMKGIYEGVILQEGQPRNDNYFHTDRMDVIQKLRENGVEIDDDKKIIMYAPTWKGSQYSNPDTSLDAYFEIIRRIEKNVDTDQYQVFVKPHQIVYYYIKNTQGVNGQFIPATVDTNEILSVVDVLISDYSSIYFDFLVSGKPILFFIPDLEEYLGYRGLYFGIDKLPGPIAKTYEELEEMVRDIDGAMKPHLGKYQKERQWACPKDDGKVCERIVNTVFHGAVSQAAVRCSQTEKKKLLLYGGSFGECGLTYSFLTFLKLLDYEKFDVTLLVDKNTEEGTQERIRSLPVGVRVLYRGMPCNATVEESAYHMLVMEHGTDGEITLPHKLYQRELRRLLGEARFDASVSFTGENGLFPVMFTYLENTQKYTWTARMVNTDRIEAEKEKPPVLQSSQGVYYVCGGQEASAVLEIETVEQPDPEMINFVSMGSLTAEKNYENEIKAFSRLYKENDKVRLYILGEGRMRRRLELLIAEENLEGVVQLLGYVPQPFTFMKQCSCFVCVSEKEGYASGVMEARALNLPLILSDFEGVSDVLMENGQYMAGYSEEAIYEGMKTFLAGGVPAYEFDAQQYNRRVYQEFDNLFKV